MSSSEREFSLSEEHKSILGINRIYVRKNILFMETKKAATIRCQYSNSLLKTTNEMRKVLVACSEFTEEDIDKFLKGFSDFYRQSEEEKEKQNSSNFGMEEEDKEGQAEKIFRLLQERCEEVFVDQFETPFAAIRVRDHMKIIKISQRPGRLRNLVYKIYRESEAIPLNPRL